MFKRCMIIIALLSPVLCKATTLHFVAEDLPPFHYFDDKNKPSGALVEVVKALINQTSVKAEIQLMPFARRYQLAGTRANYFMFSLLRTPSREERFKWVGQVYKNEAFLVGLNKRKDLEINQLNDAKKGGVGTIRGYYSETFLTAAGFIKADNLFLSVNYQQQWAMLFRQRIDLILTNNIALDRELASIGKDPKEIKQFYALKDFPNQLCIATNSNTDDKIVERLRQGLIHLKQSGQYQKIMKKWQL